jgi:ketosteroid isomerase-like protein
MADRAEKERILRELYDARVRGDLVTINRHFSENARFEMAGAPGAGHIAVKTAGAEEFRPFISHMIKIFKMSDLDIRTILIEGDKAAVHWRVKVVSTVTGQEAVTDLCDIVEFKDGRVISFVQFCDTAMAGAMMGWGRSAVLHA